MSSQRKQLVVLGSTGSIGRQALEVAARHPDRLDVIALAAYSSADTVIEQARTFGVGRVALADPDAAAAVRNALPGAEVLAGPEGVASLAGEGDIVLNALVGAAGLRSTLTALRAGVRLALANKESLVAGGDLVMKARSSPDALIPVDSEHSALFQCVLGEPRAGISRLWLTASGGPFRGADRRRLARATVEEALAHPRWSMGRKITVDSATLMNKGLEVIEAHHLFEVGYDRISVVVHPQSSVHSMVEFTDGSLKAHLGPTDMRIPIQYAFSFPERWDAPTDTQPATQMEDLTFEEPDMDTFRCLRLAYEAGRAGGTAPAVLNAANEVAVEAFLAGGAPLTAIDETVEAVLEQHEPAPLESLEQIEEADAWARETARRLLAQ